MDVLLQEKLKVCANNEDWQGVTEVLQVINDFELERYTSPKWANGSGRSHSGPWASIEFGGVIQRFCWIPAGIFLMGSPENEPERNENEIQHRVILSRGFWMAETPVTQALWTAVMGEANNPSRFKDPLRPVETISWKDAQIFIATLQQKRADLQLSLPTEAQWEYSCRAGATSSKNYESHQAQAETQKPIPKKVGSRRVKLGSPNPWGLYDMLGNIEEWCQDWFGPYLTRAHKEQGPEGYVRLNPTGPQEGTERALRGCGWSMPKGQLRAAYRSHLDPTIRLEYFGARLAHKSCSIERQTTPH